MKLARQKLNTGALKLETYFKTELVSQYLLTVLLREFHCFLAVLFFSYNIYDTFQYG